MRVLILMLACALDLVSDEIYIDQNQCFQSPNHIYSLNKNFSFGNNQNLGLIRYLKNSILREYELGNVIANQNSLVYKLVRVRKGINKPNIFELNINDFKYKDYKHINHEIIRDTIRKLKSGSKYQINFKIKQKKNLINLDTTLWTLSHLVDINKIKFKPVKIKDSLYLYFTSIEKIDSCKGYIILETDRNQLIKYPENKKWYKIGDTLDSFNRIYTVIENDTTLYKIRDPYHSQSKIYTLIPFNKNLNEFSTIHYSKNKVLQIKIINKIPILSIPIIVLTLLIFIYVFYFRKIYDKFHVYNS